MTSIYPLLHATIPIVIEDFVDRLEKFAMQAQDSDVVRLPADVVTAILSKRNAVKMRYGVEIKGLSPFVLLMKGATDALRDARRLLHQLVDMSTRFPFIAL